ncbi:MAG: hypothetical protein AB8F95_03350 [Bacteroidia bacterium]
MKRLLLLSILTMMLGGTMLFAQQKASDQQSPAQQAARQTAFLHNMLHLNQDQQQVILCAYEDLYRTRVQLMETHTAKGGSSDTYRMQLFHKQEACTQKVITSLTASQAKRYQQYLDKLKPRYGN